MRRHPPPTLARVVAKLQVRPGRGGHRLSAAEGEYVLRLLVELGLHRRRVEARRRELAIEGLRQAGVWEAAA